VVKGQIVRPLLLPTHQEVAPAVRAAMAAFHAETTGTRTLFCFLYVHTPSLPVTRTGTYRPLAERVERLIDSADSQLSCNRESHYNILQIFWPSVWATVWESSWRSAAGKSRLESIDA